MEEKWIVDRHGHRRKAIEVNCLCCGKLFLIRVRPKAGSKFCSRECAHESRRSKTKVTCAQCKIEFFKIQSQLNKSKSGFYFCSRKCKDQAQRIGGIKEIMPPHYGTSDGREIGNKYKRDRQNLQCEGCGNKKRYLLFLHHKDGDKTNNIESNFEIVCANCHVKRHLKLVSDKWRYSTRALTPREYLKDL